jgi:hypothetical protein
MSEIKRYDVNPSVDVNNDVVMEESASGIWITHSDHLAATAKLEERVRALAQQVKEDAEHTSIGAGTRREGWAAYLSPVLVGYVNDALRPQS